MLITELVDKQKLIAWLNYDGKPPVATVRTATRSYRQGPYTTTEKPVADVETLDAWWTEYRRELSEDWEKANPKCRTWKQLVAEYLSQIGIKGGKLADRINRAMAARPDIYEKLPASPQ